MSKIKRRRFFRRVQIILLAVFALGLLFVYWQIRKGEIAYEPLQTNKAVESSILPLGLTEGRPLGLTGQELIESCPKIAIIIDDVGYGGSTSEKLLQLPFSATLSILPFLRHSADIAERAHSLGYEIMLHLPMESVHPEENRGEGIIYVEMNKEEIENLIERSLDTVPYAVGVNNHMGSRVCQHPEVLELIFARIKKHNLYFVDSLVIAGSSAYQIAQEMAIPSNYRRTFLDNQSEPDYIRAQLKELKEKAVAEGQAIGIAHCRRNTIDVLTEAIPEMEKEGIEFVFASELVK